MLYARPREKQLALRELAVSSVKAGGQGRICGFQRTGVAQERTCQALGFQEMRAVCHCKRKPSGPPGH